MVEVPEHLLERSRERRRQLGLPVPGEDDSTEGGGEAEEQPAQEQPAEEQPEQQPAQQPAAQEQAAQQPAAAGGGSANYFEELSQTSGVPAHLLERSARRRSQLTGEPMPGGDGGGEGAGAPAPAAAPAAAATATATAPAPAPTAAGPAGHTHRLLTVVKAGSIQQTKTSPVDKVFVWPHLLVFELTSLLALTAVLIVFSALVRAPLLELADPNLTPNPSKAPWYFLGLQELLTMFHPMVAGVLIPGFGLVALGAAPYVDKNPSNDPAERKFAVSLFTVFIVSASILAIIGSFFRGPGFNFTFPWVDGIFFDL